MLAMRALVTSGSGGEGSVVCDASFEVVGLGAGRPGLDDFGEMVVLEGISGALDSVVGDVGASVVFLARPGAAVRFPSGPGCPFRELRLFEFPLPLPLLLSLSRMMIRSRRLCTPATCSSILHPRPKRCIVALHLGESDSGGTKK